MRPPAHHRALISTQNHEGNTPLQLAINNECALLVGVTYVVSMLKFLSDSLIVYFYAIEK